MRHDLLDQSVDIGLSDAGHVGLVSKWLLHSIRS